MSEVTPMKKVTTNTMTAADAKTFKFKSANNSNSIENAVHRIIGCDCKAYEDIFTFSRWKAMNMRVPKGAIKVSILVPARKTYADIKASDTEAFLTGTTVDARITRLDEDDVKFVRRTINVWCRCVVTPYVPSK
tara:strand:- start:117 stop:518 length:402 start_codon:yes stop_codon:yes gene_type:complete